MEKNAIDYYGITTLDSRVVDLLNHFLRERESHLASQILQVLPYSVEHSDELKLTDALDGFTKQVRALAKMHGSGVPAKESSGVITELNVALWEYTEILEGCAVELFQQVKQINVSQWNGVLLDVVQAIKKSLIHHIDELSWLIKRLDQQLLEYSRAVGDPKRSRWAAWFRTPSDSALDPNLQKHLFQVHKLLKQEYDSFYSHFQKLKELNREADATLVRYSRFGVLPLLEDIEQAYYQDIVKLLHYWKFNADTDDELGITRTLRSIASVQFIKKAYKNYYEHLKTALFRSSIQLKEVGKVSDEAFATLITNAIKERVEKDREELHEFVKTMNLHREFLLKTDPNPYVGSRWGFTERPVAPEPQKTKSILELIYNAEELDRWYGQFLDSLGDDYEEADLPALLADITKILHEMSQPLISRAMMRRSAGRLLDKMNACNELGSSSIDLIDEIETILNKGQRLDWKYHVLHESPLFHEIYQIHKGLRREAEDIKHCVRSEKFQQLCQRIQGRLANEDLMSHAHEIELDMNDIKIYLQDFFATVQRVIREKHADPQFGEMVSGLKHQLLDYRYLFGDFFLNLMNQQSEGNLLRNQFLFVDQYFESIEGLWRGLEQPK